MKTATHIASGKRFAIVSPNRCENGEDVFSYQALKNGEPIGPIRTGLQEHFVDTVEDETATQERVN